MASSIKKRAVNSKSETENESGINMDEEIQADFEGRNLEAQDFNGIRQLLKQVFLKEHVDISQLGDLLIAQEGIGSVLKQSWNEDEDDDDDDTDMLTEALDVFGITSVLNLSSHRETPVVQQLFELVQRLTQNADEAAKTKIEQILSNCKKMALLINERFVNLPAKIADPLLTSLQAELSRMAKKDPSYDFEYYVLICKIFKPKGQKSQVIFSNAEEEIFSNEAEVSIEYSVTSQCDTALGGQWTEEDVEMIPHRRILFIQGSKLPLIIQRIKEFVA